MNKEVIDITDFSKFCDAIEKENRRELAEMGDADYYRRVGKFGPVERMPEGYFDAVCRKTE